MQADGKISLADENGNLDLSRVKFENLQSGSIVGDFIIMAPPGTSAATLAFIKAAVVADPSACGTLSLQ